MPYYLLHPKPKKAVFGATLGLHLSGGEKTKVETLKEALTRLYILAPPPPADTSISWYQDDLPLSKVQKAAPLLIFLSGSQYNLGSTPVALKPSELACLHRMRALLWSVCPDPWVGRWTFLNPGLSRMPWYSTLVSKVSAGATVVDIGCGVGLDMRQLANDAKVAPGKLFAMDSRPAIWEIGEKLFGVDERIEFLDDDVTNELEWKGNLLRLKGKVDIIVVCHLLDQSDYPRHLETLETLAKLSEVGTQIVGYTLGATGKDVTVGTIFENDCGCRYRHDARSFRMIWGLIMNRTGTKWIFEYLETIELEKVGWEREDVNCAKVDLKALHFTFTRIE